VKELKGPFDFVFSDADKNYIFISFFRQDRQDIQDKKQKIINESV